MGVKGGVGTCQAHVDVTPMPYFDDTVYNPCVQLLLHHDRVVHTDVVCFAEGLP